MTPDAGEVVIVSLYASPIHRGHIDYIHRAREIAGPHGRVYAIVNTDQQSILKKGYSFVPETDRLAVVGALRDVDRVFLSIDTDRSVCQTIAWICDTVVPRPTVIYNEGDVTGGCPEERIGREYDLRMIYGNTPKVQSSSWILEHSVTRAYHHMHNDKM